MTHDTPPICNYEGSTYRTDFWEGRGRNYEDQVERIAINRLLPFNGGRRLIEIGAAYGRLVPVYHAYEQVVLFDYSMSQLRDAQANLGRNRRYIYVAGDVYRMPFRAGVFDGVTMIRVLHHLRDVQLALGQVRGLTAPGGMFVLEHANKRNLKAMLRYAVGRQDWSPYTRLPHEFVELNIDFHPEHVTDELRSTGFEVMRRLPVSYLRLGMLKQALPIEWLVDLDSLLQNLPAYYSPSVFTKNIAIGDTPDNTDIALDAPDSLFVSPDTGNALRRQGDEMIDDSNGQRWAVRDGIYDFKAPLS